MWENANLSMLAESFVTMPCHFSNCGWRSFLAADILDKQTRDGIPAWGWTGGYCHQRTVAYYEMSHRASNWASFCEYGIEPSSSINGEGFMIR
jgi:hypothetical protein